MLSGSEVGQFFYFSLGSKNPSESCVLAGQNTESKGVASICPDLQTIIKTTIICRHHRCEQQSTHCTANLFTAKTTGFHCVQIPTALSLHFLQSLTTCSQSLQSSWSAAETLHFLQANDNRLLLQKLCKFSIVLMQILLIFECIFNPQYIGEFHKVSMQILQVIS